MDNIIKVDFRKISKEEYFKSLKERLEYIEVLEELDLEDLEEAA